MEIANPALPRKSYSRSSLQKLIFSLLAIIQFIYISPTTYQS